MAFGVTPTGFNKKTLADVLADIEAEQKSAIDPNLNTTLTGILGHLNSIFGGVVANEGWNVLADVYAAAYPDSADAASLDQVASLTAVVRQAATKSTATIIATGTDATVLALGRLASVAGTDRQFVTLAGGTISLATAWAVTTAYSLGDLRRNDTPNNIYLCTGAGTSAGSGGPTGESSSITDGTCTWRFIGDGEGYDQIAAESVNTGPIVGQAYTIGQIDTPVSGWESVSNLTDADLGSDIETDASLRQRREREIRAIGSSSVDAIRAKVDQVADVSEVFVFENTTLAVDANLLPGKSFEVIARGGLAPAIGQVIWDNKPAGIQAWGQDESEVINDTQGNAHTIEFSRPLGIACAIAYTLTTDGDYPADGDAQVIAAALAEVAAIRIGEDVIYSKLLCAPFSVAGVVDVLDMRIDRLPSTVLSANAETYALTGGETLTIKVDGESPAQTVTIAAIDITVGAATALQIANVITTQLLGGTGADDTGSVRITSDKGGTIEVTGGTANALIGFATTFTPTGSANIVIASRELAGFESTRITVA